MLNIYHPMWSHPKLAKLGLSDFLGHNSYSAIGSSCYCKDTEIVIATFQIHAAFASQSFCSSFTALGISDLHHQAGTRHLAIKHYLDFI